MSNYENILTETRGRVGIITLDRPKALNALNYKTMEEAGAVATSFDRDSGIDAITITGFGKALAAGMDIKGTVDKSGTEICVSDQFSGRSVFTSVRIPVIAAVNDYALGGGRGVAIVADLIIAGSGAKFSRPEVNLDVVPGMGGPQRFTRTIDRTEAMETCLTGCMMGTGEAELTGLVARIVEPGALLDGTLEIAGTIAPKSLVVITQVREQTDQAYEMTLSQGLFFGRRTFHSLLSSNDQKEGMATLTRRRETNFTNS